jgi:hypothetical protein
MKNKNKFLTNMRIRLIIKWIVTPMLLLFLWLCLSLLYSSYKSFTVLQYAHYQDKKNDFFGKKILKDKTLTGSFYAKDNHLGIVAVRFGEVPRVDFENEDIIIFKIKEKGKREWLFQNKYRSGAFTSNDYYPFGFEEITNSKGKEYIFEISSKKGRTENSLETKNSDPIYLSKYKYSKSEIFSSFQSLAKFMKEKIITFMTNLNSVLSSIVFLLPFIFYISWISTSKRWIKNRNKIDNKKILAAFIAMLILFDIIFYEFINIGFMVGLLGLWVGVSMFNKFKSAVTFILSLSIILISLCGIYFHLKISIDKASTFAYFLMVIGFIQSIKEYKLGIEKQKNNRSLHKRR